MNFENTCFVLAQITGVFIVVTNSISAFNKNKKKLVFYNAVANGLCSLQYLLLGAFTGAICCLVAVFRNLVFSMYKKKIPWYIFMLVASALVLINVPFVHSIIDILPILATLVYTYALYKNQVIKIKKSLVLSGIFGSIFDIKERAYTGLFVNVVDFLGGLKGVIDSKKKKIKA